MIFEGQVDETDVILLKALEIEVSLGAINNQSLTANLRFIAPKVLISKAQLNLK